MKKILALTIAVSIAIGASGCARAANPQPEAQNSTDSNQSWQVKTGNIQDTKNSLGSFPEFETVDLEGNKVTKDIFGQSRLTIVTLWATT